MVEIERAGVKDHGVVTSLLLNLSTTQGWKPEVDSDRWDRVVAELLNSDGWLFLLAREDGKPVGLAAVNWFLTLYGSREQARVAALIVDAEYRGRGIGTEIMREVLAAARRRGCRELEAPVDPQGEDVKEFYSKLNPTREQRLLVWPCVE